jgi:predicted regulator of Ras-like GTPase activity (Roadblock/LC7/MglB family)
MNPEEWSDALRQLTGIAGVLGALIISADDGLVVAETAIDELATADVAALAAALVSRATRCTAAMRAGAPSSVHLLAEQGAVLAVAGPAPLWLVAVARHDAELGRLRLLLRDFAGALR